MKNKNKIVFLYYCFLKKTKFLYKNYCLLNIMTTYEVTFNEKSKVGKDLLSFFEQNKKQIKVNDPTLMTKEEFEAEIEESYQEYLRGEYTEVEYDEIDKFIDQL